MHRWNCLGLAAVVCILFAAAGGTRAQTPPGPELDRLRKEGIAAANRADFAAAEDLFQAGLKRARDAGDESKTAGFLYCLGFVYATRNPPENAKAVDHYRRALALHERLGEEAGIIACLNNLGNVYKSLSQYEQALECHTRALALFEKRGNPAAVAMSLNNVGNIYTDQGRYTQAVEVYVRALTLREQLGDQAGIAASLIGLGIVYDDLAQCDLALAYHTRALDLRRKLGNEKNVAGSLNNLGAVSLSQGHVGQAQEYFSQALALREKLSDQEGIAESLSNLGSVFGAQTQYDKAIEYYRRSMTIFEGLGSQYGVAANLHDLGAVYEELRRRPEELDYYTRAETLWEKLGVQSGLAASLEGLGRLALDQGQPEKALRYFERARLLREQMSDLLGGSEQRGGYGEKFGRVYGLSATALLALHRPTDALVASERGRAQGLARQIAQNGADLSRFLAAEDVARLTAAVEKRSAAQVSLHTARMALEQAGAQARSENQKRVAEAVQGSRDADRACRLVRDGLYARYPMFRRLRAGEPPSVTQLQDLAWRYPDALFLEWAIARDRQTVLCALSHREGVRAFALPVGSDRLAELTRKWRTALTGMRASEIRDGQALYQTLFAPLEKAGLLQPGRSRRLVIVADGPLLDVPFGAMPDAAGHRLIDRFAVSSAVSLGVLTWPPNPRRPTGTLLCVTDPSTAKTDPGASPLREGLGPLRFAQQESRRVAEEFPGAVRLAGGGVREGTVKQAMPRFGLLHFATHGVLVPDQGMLSWLLLAPEAKESPEDGRLEAREIVGIPLSARLAVLSACETGRGQPMSGEGRLGLASAFLGAGCPSVVASLWKVDDAATGRLMSMFYREAKAGRPLDEALRTAQQATRKDYPLPAYWAGFYLIGDARPLPPDIIGRSGKKL